MNKLKGRVIATEIRIDKHNLGRMSPDFAAGYKQRSIADAKTRFMRELMAAELAPGEVVVWKQFIIEDAEAHWRKVKYEHAEGDEVKAIEELLANAHNAYIHVIHVAKVATIDEHVFDEYGVTALFPEALRWLHDIQWWHR